MWNTAIKDHFRFNSQCEGDLIWDDDASKKWGLGWKAVLTCDRCSYKSQQFKHQLRLTLRIIWSHVKKK